MSLAEIIVILVVALVVLGPERLPQVARTAGRLYNKSKTCLEEFAHQLDEQAKHDTLDENTKKAEEADKKYNK